MAHAAHEVPDGPASEIAQLEEAATEIRLRLTKLKRSRAGKLAAAASARVRGDRADATARAVFDMYCRSSGGRSAMRAVVEQTGLKERTAYRLLDRGMDLYCAEHPPKPPAAMQEDLNRAYDDQFKIGDAAGD
jgi:hypothetical protein